MYKKLLFFLLVPVLGISQVQIGQDIDGENAGDGSGYSVSLSSDGKVVAVSGIGFVRIYQSQSGIWTKIGQDIKGGFSGNKIALSSDGTMVATSVLGVNNNAYVQVHQYIAGGWTQIGQDIDIKKTNTLVSLAFSSDGSILAVGDPEGRNLSNETNGSVRVFQNISGGWTQIGQDIKWDNVSEIMGQSGWYIDLSADGTIVAIGSPRGLERVDVYQNISGVWTQIGNRISKIGQYVGEENGYRVALSADGSVVALGARYNDVNGNNAGRVSVYENVANNWVQIGSDIFGEAAGDQCSMVALSDNGEVLAVGSFGSDVNGFNSGHVRIFQNISGTWVQQGTNIEGLDAGDYSGFGLALSADGTNLVIGSPKLDSTSGSSAKNQVNSIGTSHIRVYDISGILSTNNFVSESFDVFPNPVSDILNIRMKNNLTLEKVTVYNNSGQIVKTAQQSTIDVSNLSSGVYFIEITTNQGIATKKVIVK